MSIRINNVLLDIDEPKSNLKLKVAKRLSIKPEEICNMKIIRESIDARKKENIKLNYAIELTCKNEEKKVFKSRDKDIFIERVQTTSKIKFGNVPMTNRPLIVGMGPAGLFAGLILAQNGYKPIIIERGEQVEERTKTVNNFWQTGKLNLESNVQFGEGGAGTFSDGKLTTRIKDSRCDYVLEELVKAGAPKEILYMGMPHIGTDILKGVVINIRKRIIELGGEVRFNSKLEDLVIKNGSLRAAVINGEQIPCENLILAMGHSSRDTYKMLMDKQITMKAKAFAIGVRVEHLKTLIDENQYGKYSTHPKLSAASYRLTHTCESNKRSVYSFCMCPGGEVVAAASEEGMLVINGMSNYKRNFRNSNSAIVVTVNPSDFHGNSPLAGMEFQRHYEKLAFDLGGGGYIAPIQLVEDFLEDRISEKFGEVKPSYAPGCEFRDMRSCLPDYVVNSLKEGLTTFDKKIKGFASSGALITGIETRTSAPVQIARNEKFESLALKGLYPAGEGAGYAGGIISAAVDGLRCAESVMNDFAPKI